MLHGYAQNATIFSKRLAAFRKACGDELELVFIDAPHILKPVDATDTFLSTNSLDAFGTSEIIDDPLLTPRCWWCKADTAKTELGGLEDSITLLKDVLAKDHYVGVFGFSQGAAMAAVLAALLEKPHVYSPFLIDGKAPHPPFEFCVSVAGFKPPGLIRPPIFESSYSTPTLHILGRTDVVVIQERSKTLLDISSNKRVEWHDGGHFVPSNKRWRAFMRDYLLNPTGDIASPGIV